MSLFIPVDGFMFGCVVTVFMPCNAKVLGFITLSTNIQIYKPRNVAKVIFPMRIVIRDVVTNDC